MAWADWMHIPKAPENALLSPVRDPAPRSVASSGTRTSAGMRRDPVARSHATSRSSTPAPSTIFNQSEAGHSAHSSPSSSSAAHASGSALSHESTAQALKQFKSAYEALRALQGGLGSVGRSLGLPPYPAQPLLHGEAGGPAAGGATGSGGGGGGGGGEVAHAMDPKPLQADSHSHGSIPAAPASSTPSHHPPASAAAAPGALPAAHGLPSAAEKLASLLLGPEGSVAVEGEKSLKQLYEETVAARRKLAQELKAAKEEVEELRKNNRVLEQKLTRKMTANE